MSGKPLKYPVSALVVLHDEDGNILLIERTAPQGFWQSVTGSLEEGERIRPNSTRYAHRPATGRTRCLRLVWCRRSGGKSVFPFQ